jgi:DNA helicase-2/ATP-dependent DNA helicase PcrA
MTIHQAKGLEFDEVFLLGWNKGQIPSSLCQKDDQPDLSYEEERRVAFVALTRARK